MSDSSERLGAPDWTLLGATAALVALGLLLVLSTTAEMGYRGYENPAYYFGRQLLWFGVGTILMVGAAWLPHKHWTKLSIPILILSLLLLLYLVLSGKQERTLTESGSISPAELAKLAVVVYIGHWLASKGDLLRQLPYGLLPFTIMVGVFAGLVVAHQDISEAVIIVLVAGAMFFLAGADLIQFLIGMTGGLAAFALVILRLDTVNQRVGPFIESWRSPLESTNEHLTRGLTALGSGGIFGLGPGSGRMKYRWLPVPHTDSIFAAAGEELGLVGCLVLLGLFGLVVYRGLRIASKSPDAFGELLAAGITCWIAIQALINLGVVTGLIPFSGTALPFISQGGSSLVMLMIGVGIMLSVSRATNRKRSAT